MATLQLVHERYIRKLLGSAIPFDLKFGGAGIYVDCRHTHVYHCIISSIFHSTLCIIMHIRVNAHTHTTERQSQNIARTVISHETLARGLTLKLFLKSYNIISQTRHSHSASQLWASDLSCRMHFTSITWLLSFSVLSSRLIMQNASHRHVMVAQLLSFEL